MTLPVFDVKTKFMPMKPSSAACRQKPMNKSCRAKRQVKGFHGFIS
jgi:hypothetical protein